MHSIRCLTLTPTHLAAYMYSCALFNSSNTSTDPKTLVGPVWMFAKAGLHCGIT